MGCEWTDEDLVLLEEFQASKTPWTAVADHFPGRSPDAIRLKANAKFGPRPRDFEIKPWTAEDLLVLMTHKDKETRGQIGKRLGRSESSVQTKLRQLGHVQRTYRRWTAEDEHTLMWWWGNEPPEKTAERVGRTMYGCQQKIYKLLGRGGHLTGFVTLNQLSGWHGRSTQTYLKAAKELRVQFRTHRTGSGRVWRLFSEEQADQILEHLNRPAKFLTQAGVEVHRWARDFDQCIHCKTDGTDYQQRHGGNGLCIRCHQRWRRGTIKVSSLPPFGALRKRWSIKYDCCIACATTSRQHAGKGLCDACKRKVKRGLLEPLLVWFREQTP